MTVFIVPESEGSKKGNRFAFRGKDGGRIYSVPFLQYLSGESAAMVGKAVDENWDEARLTRGLIGVECPAAADAVLKMANDQVISLSRAWTEASSAAVGESVGSENS
ncbi:hypothetical protein D5S18_02980 [Nocardia panacis]|uniref:Uncharacterized protein n=1 Tax=Nocardia panacis TaxID=2340916 RepID=A0A3A4KVN9_9NOCA|nr:hypothetical protein [Nocardia panacis]RJO79310.1 hypothetical protein D5S18_02980 [Nocardia panacis]